MSTDPLNDLVRLHGHIKSLIAMRKRQAKIREQSHSDPSPARARKIHADQAWLGMEIDKAAREAHAAAVDCGIADSRPPASKSGSRYSRPSHPDPGGTYGSPRAHVQRREQPEALRLREVRQCILPENLRGARGSMPRRRPPRRRGMLQASLLRVRHGTGQQMDSLPAMP